MKYIVFVFLSLSLLSCSKPEVPIKNTPATISKRTTEQKLGTVFPPLEDKHFNPPQVSIVEFPEPIDGGAIWGAIGRDDDGKVYFGSSSLNHSHNTAFLYQFDPEANVVVKQSDTVTELRRAGFDEEKLAQNKLHSKFYQANDGYLYFSSFDETGENGNEHINPLNGGHLWRKKPDDLTWEHLLAAPEALISVNTDGRYVYALGYWNHVLYQFDTITQQVKSKVIGAQGNHISRNIVVNNNKVFVPRIAYESPDLVNSRENAIVELVEINSAMKEINTYPLTAYFHSENNSNHGIVAYANTKHGQALFITGSGALYKIEQTPEGSHAVKFVEFLGDTASTPEYYSPVLFSIEGESLFLSLGRAKNPNRQTWFIHESVNEITLPHTLESDILSEALFYGSVTRDNQGNYYIGGTTGTRKENARPVLIKFSYDDAAPE